VLRHVEQKRNVAMYLTNVPTVAAGLLSGPLAVTMRPLSAAAIRATFQGEIAGESNLQLSRCAYGRFLVRLLDGS